MRKIRRVDLGPLCGYMGGKRIFAPTIAAWILARKPAHVFDLCCGSGAISIALVQRGYPPSQISMVDIGPWGSFFRKLTDGTLDLAWIYRVLFQDWPRANPQEWLERTSQSLPDTPEAFIVLQRATFGAMSIWFDGHWRGGGRTLSWKSDSEDKLTWTSRLRFWALLEVLTTRLKGITAVHGSVFDRTTPWLRESMQGLRYIDPPYGETAGYGSSYYSASFDLDSFIRQCPRPLFISEQRAIPGATRSVAIGARPAKAMGGGSTASAQEFLNIFD